MVPSTDWDGHMNRISADIIREYGPFSEAVHGVTFDGQRVWFASGDRLNAFDPSSGKVLRSVDVAAHAGTAFDGQYLFQLAEDRIQKIDPDTGRVLATIPAPGGGGDGTGRGSGAARPCRARAGWSARCGRGVRRWRCGKEPWSSSLGREPPKLRP